MCTAEAVVSAVVCMQFGSDQTPDDLKHPWGMAKNSLHWLAVRGMRAAVSYKPWLPLWQQYAPQTGENTAQ
jgi:hypothetical protein